MKNKITKGFYILVGMVIGIVVAELLKNNDTIKKIWLINDDISRNIIYYLGISILFGIIIYILSPVITFSSKKLIKYIEINAQKIDITDLFLIIVSTTIGLIISALISVLLNKIPIIGVALSVITYLGVTAIFIIIGLIKKEEITNFFMLIKKKGNYNSNNMEENIKNKKDGKSRKLENIKILDTSVIIDGRIFDLCKTGFIEGKLIIPNFVLDELRHISDSVDGLKRNRGRRGLDILNKIQKELDIEVEITYKDYQNIQEVDGKLLKLTTDLKGKILTNDYNLNKVAEVQGVFVLNINELANAIKPIVLPGEKMNIQIVKEGKEHNQGIAYLDDGTMIVVEGGRKKVGENLSVEVTSILQTAAGRMIFANILKE